MFVSQADNLFGPFEERKKTVFVVAFNFFNLNQWFSTFFSLRHTKHQKKFGGTLIKNLKQDLENSFILLIAAKISFFSAKQ